LKLLRPDGGADGSIVACAVCRIEKLPFKGLAQPVKPGDPAGFAGYPSWPVCEFGLDTATALPANINIQVV
jgi:hypothetical protein